jgi:hypothetical protein
MSVVPRFPRDARAGTASTDQLSGPFDDLRASRRFHRDGGVFFIPADCAEGAAASGPGERSLSRAGPGDRPNAHFSSTGTMSCSISSARWRKSAAISLAPAASSSSATWRMRATSRALPLGADAVVSCPFFLIPGKRPSMASPISRAWRMRAASSSSDGLSISRGRKHRSSFQTNYVDVAPDVAPA